jgi:hypothetical protein
MKLIPESWLKKANKKARVENYTVFKVRAIQKSSEYFRFEKCSWN